MVDNDQVTAGTAGNDTLLAEQLPAYETTVEVPLSRPDITPAQVVALIPVCAALLSAFGVYSLSEVQQEALTDAVTAGLALVGADALIRVGRAIAHRSV